MFKLILTSTVFFILWLFAVTSTAQTPNTNSVTYKGTKFGVSEKVFTLQRQNEGFVCTEALDKVGRQCVSEAATYADRKVTTSARFINDKLIYVSITFPTSTDITSEIFSDIAIPGLLEDQHGTPNETKWPDESVNGVKTWKKVWIKKDGTSLMYMRSLSVGGEFKINDRFVFLSSKDADKIYIETKKIRKTDM